MNEKLSYAKMLDIPMSSSVSPIKKKFPKLRKRKCEKVKKQLIDKVNNDVSNCNNELDEINTCPNCSSNCNFILVDSKKIENNEIKLNDSIIEKEDEMPPSSVVIKKISKKRAFSFIGAEICAIVLLIATIVITNQVLPNSGINTFFRQVFSSSSTSVSTTIDKKYNEFTPTFNGEFSMSSKNGTISILGKGSFYCPIDGKVSLLSKNEDGSFDLEVTHSNSFKTLITGISKVYCAEGDNVYKNIPVGYLDNDSIKLCFLDDSDCVISCYSLSGNSVIWTE